MERGALGSLDPEDAEAVRRFEEERGPAGRPLDISRLVQRWSTFVGAVEAGYTDGIDEYLHDLSVRNLLQEFVDHTTPGLAARMHAVLQPLDDRFTAATDVDEAGRLASLFRSSHAWWWKRIPVAGDIAEELEGVS